MRGTIPSCNGGMKVYRSSGRDNRPQLAHIRAEAADIRSHWSVDERRRRRRLAQVSQWALLSPVSEVLADS